MFNKLRRQSHDENEFSQDAMSASSAYPEYMSGLNEQQLRSVLETEGYVRVIAGAGSGKTHTLTTRVIYLIDTLGIAPQNLLCVTFTNKAANEMRNRVMRRLGEGAAGALIMTFGSLWARIIREDGNAIGYPASYQIIDEEDSKRLLADLLKEAKEEFATKFAVDESIKVKKMKACLQMKAHPLDPLPHLFSQRMLQPLEDISQKSNELRARLESTGYNKDTFIEYILTRYVYEKRKSFACDFEDLASMAYMILTKSDAARQKWQDKLKYIMVDEYQDVSGAEVALLTILQEKYKNLFVVGDSDQTIYSFRGSKVEYIIDFDKEFVPAKTILLTKNYRSGSMILDASNTLVKKNKFRIDKDLQPDKQEQGSVTYFHAKDIYEEAHFVVHNIKSFITQGLSYNDIAILYRSHHVSRVIEEELLKENVPYRVYSGVGFYQRKEIKDVLAYMRVLIGGDDISFTRIVNEPKRQIGPKSLKVLNNFANSHKTTLLEAFLHLSKNESLQFANPKKQELANMVEKFRKDKHKILSTEHPISDLMVYALENSGYEEMLRNGGEEDRLDNLAEFKISLVHYEEAQQGEEVSVEEYLQTVSLLTSQEMDDTNEKVSMMTVHAAKGLEYPAIFVVALNEGIFPSSKINSPEDMEEERRLAYVAYTRAKDLLILSDAEGINFNGSRRYPSRFIFDAEPVNMDYLVELDQDLLDSYGKYPALTEKPKENFSKDEIVNHKVFGRGVVVGVEDGYVRVKFDNKPEELLLAAAVISHQDNM